MAVGRVLYSFGAIFLIHTLLQLYSFSAAQTCGYKPPLASEVSYAAVASSGHSVSKRQTTYQSIRIGTFYDSTIDALSASQRNLIQNDVVPELVKFIRNVLSVQPFGGNILFSHSCTGTRLINTDQSSSDTLCEGSGSCGASTTCGSFIIPNSHLSGCQECPGGRNCQPAVSAGTGVADVDFVLYISANGRSPCGGSSSSQIIAFASHCQLDKSTDRPLAGFANICPSALDRTDLKSTVKHELLHALGISNQLFPFWRDQNGNPRTRRVSQGFPPRQGNSFVADNNTVMSTTRMRDTINGARSNNLQFLVTERVQSEVRSHFGCSSLVGAELENQGGNATIGSHWEKRIFENEAMTGQLTQNPAFSRITLAALEDTGWYQVNYQYAMPFRFGKDLGCSFTDESCYSWISSNASPLPFCNVQPPQGSTGRTDCTPDYFSKGRCNLATFTGDLPEQYRYFSNNAQGGSVEIADYCPFYQEFSFVGGRRTQCSVSTNQPVDGSNVFAEMYGSSSRCFRHGASRTWTVNQQSFQSTGGSGCYEYSCSPTSGVTVYILGQALTCDCEGKEILFRVTDRGTVYEGSILCPACTDLCWDQPQMCPASSGNCSGTTDMTGGAGAVHAGVIIVILAMGLAFWIV